MQVYTLWRLWETWMQRVRKLKCTVRITRGSHKDCDDFRELNLTSDWEQDKCHGIFKPRATD